MSEVLAKAMIAGGKTATMVNGSRLLYSTSNSLQSVAGPNSLGIVVDGYGVPKTIQFGTKSTDSPANTSFTVTSSGMVSGAAYELVNTDTNGDQYSFGERMVWRASTKALELTQFQDDALVSNTPRFQLYFHSILHRTCGYRFYLDFTLGNSKASWPVLSPIGRDNVLIFQINPDVGEVPPFNIQIRKPKNGLEDYRDIEILRRRDNYSNQTPGSANDGMIGDGTGEDYVCVIENVSKYGMHSIIIDFKADWLNVSDGGCGYFAVTYQGQRMELHPHVGGGKVYRGQTIYPTTAAASGNVLHLPMIGIYRTNYQGVKAPDSCGITFYRADMMITSYNL